MMIMRLRIFPVLFVCALFILAIAAECSADQAVKKSEIDIIIKGKSIDELKIEPDFSKIDRTDPGKVALGFFELENAEIEIESKYRRIIFDSFIEEAKPLLEMGAIIESKRFKDGVSESERRLIGYDCKVSSSDIKEKDAKVELDVVPIYKMSRSGVVKLSVSLKKIDKNWYIDRIEYDCYMCGRSGICRQCRDQNDPALVQKCELCKGTKKCDKCKGTGRINITDFGFRLPENKFADFKPDRSSPKAAVKSILALADKYRYLSEKIMIENMHLKYGEIFILPEVLDKMKKEKNNWEPESDYIEIKEVLGDGTSVNVEVKGRLLFGRIEKLGNPVSQCYNTRKGDDGLWTIINRVTKCDKCNEGKCRYCGGRRAAPGDQNRCPHCGGTGNCQVCGGSRSKTIPFTLW